MSISNKQIQNEEPLLRRRTTIIHNYQKIDIGKINKNFNDNKISTNKYTLLTFLPLNLFEQFSKSANIYFLMIAILQTVSIISITHGQPTILLPLIFIITLTACKDIFEDYSRYKSDKSENEKQCTVIIDEQNIQNKRWRDLRPGEIIKIKQNEYFPADCVLLQTSNQQQNIAFVETKNLDGETSLQKKEISNYKFINIQNIIEQNDKIYVDDNLGQLQQFYGYFQNNQNQIFLSQENLFLRGSSLQNTEWVLCVIVYTGKNTKIMLNSMRTKLKSGTIDTKTSLIVLMTFVFQFILCVIAALIYSLDMSNYKRQKETNQFTFIQMFIMKIGNWTLILGNFIPISLLVTLEMVKFFQALIINRDDDLKYHITQNNQETICIGCKVQNSSVNEDLGQVNYIFTDKTGTLTENVMKFQSLLIEDREFFNDQNQTNQENKDEQNIQMAFKNLALCHSIIFDQQNKPTSSSSEEIAIHEFLVKQQQQYIENQIIQNDEFRKNYFVINNKGEQEKWEIKKVFEFSSEKKRMSVLTLYQNKVYLFTKGADEIIWNKLSQNQKSQKLLNNISQKAKEGLRILVLAFKEFTLEESQQILNQIQSTSEKIIEDILLDKIQNQLEQNMNLIGAIVLQDKLQDQVVESIQFIRQAKIKIWMITGDKTQTALSIGKSSKLINNNDKVYILEDNYQQFFDMLKNINFTNQQYSVVIKGSFMMKLSLKYNFIFDQFLSFLLQAQSIVFSRATPKLKAIIVNMIKNQKNQYITLAIGDGANDVNMINTAHVGIGLKGLEGKQAARASDYQVSRFKHIIPLLFYYGRENYRKNTTLVLYILYKNILIVMINYWFGFLNTFSGQSLYESYTFQLFNVLVTFLPPFVFAIFDFTGSKQQFLETPQKYKVCQDRIYFSFNRFLSFFANSMIVSLILMFTGLIVFDYSTIQNGYFYGLWNMGNMCFYGGVLITNIKLLAISNSISIISILCYIISIFNFFCVWKLLNFIKQNDLYNTYIEVMIQPQFYVFTICLLVLSQIERIIENFISRKIMKKYK